MKKFLLVLLALCAFSTPVWAAVDLNTATAEQLQSVKGIGPKKAQAIVEYRKKNGPFKSTDELDKVPGFGKTSVDKMKKEITVGNAKAAAAGKPEKAVKEAMPAAKPADKAAPKK